MLGIIIVLGWLTLCIALQTITEYKRNVEKENLKRQYNRNKKRNEYHDTLWDVDFDFSEVKRNTDSSVHFKEARREIASDRRSA